MSLFLMRAGMEYASLFTFTNGHKNYQLIKTRQSEKFHLYNDNDNSAKKELSAFPEPFTGANYLYSEVLLSGGEPRNNHIH